MAILPHPWPNAGGPQPNIAIILPWILPVRQNSFIVALDHDGKTCRMGGFLKFAPIRRSPPAGFMRQKAVEQVRGSVAKADGSGNFPIQVVPTRQRAFPSQIN